MVQAEDSLTLLMKVDHYFFGKVCQVTSVSFVQYYLTIIVNNWINMYFTSCNMKQNSDYLFFSEGQISSCVIFNSPFLIGYFLCVCVCVCVQRHQCYINRSPACRALSLEGQPTEDSQDGEFNSLDSSCHSLPELWHYIHLRTSTFISII